MNDIIYFQFNIRNFHKFKEYNIGGFFLYDFEIVHGKIPYSMIFQTDTNEVIGYNQWIVLFKNKLYYGDDITILLRKIKLKILNNED